MKKKIIILVLVLSLLVFVSVMAFGQPSSSVRWEYRSVRSASVELMSINDLGNEGWELVQIIKIDPNMNTGYMFVFKRRK